MIAAYLATIVRGEESRAARILSIAMLNNPIHIAVLCGHGETQRQHLEDMFSTMLRDRPGDIFLMKHNDTIVGVLRSRGGCHGSSGSDDQATRPAEVEEAELKDVDARIQYWANVWGQRDPMEPHRHLGPLGVLPQFQGLGVGRRMLEAFCAQVDSSSELAFLETDTIANVRFYEKFGFRTIGENLVFGVKCFFMSRLAQR